jgi:hypothetical protein
MNPFWKMSPTAKKGVSWRFVSFILILASSAAAIAAEDVGVAISVRNEVTGKMQSQTVKINSGNNVFGQEIVRTAPDSSAKIVLKDSTNLNVGPNSSVTLDKFVFQGDSDYKQAGFNLAKGTFRFTSGGSDKRAYDLKTPTATIGVRGTDFTVVVNGRMSHMELADGQTLVCPIRGAQDQPLLKKANERCGQRSSRNQLSTSNDGRADSCECRKGCVEVKTGEAVDVGDFCVFQSQFTGVQVGEGPVNFGEAAGAGALGSMGALAPLAVAGAAAAGGAAAAATSSSGSGSGSSGAAAAALLPKPPVSP